MLAGGVMLAGCGAKPNRPRAGTSGKSAESETPQQGGTLNTSVASNAASFDRQVTKQQTTNAIVSHVLSRPFRNKTAPDPSVALNREIENDLATSAESPDGVTWTLKLRPDARFQNTAPVNGHAVEAEDIKSTFVRSLSIPGSQSSASLLMVDANQIEAPTKDTLVFKLKYAYGPFPNTISSAAAAVIYPREVLAGVYDPAKQIIGSGPFMLDSYTPDVAITYKKNPDWFDKPRPYIDGERSAIIPNPAQQLAQFTAGNLDDLNVGRNNLDAAKTSNAKATVVTAPYPQAYQVYGHMDRPDSAYRDIRVRQAISMAIDREAIGKAVFNGEYHNNGVLPVSQGKWALPPDQLGPASQYYTYNLDAAKKLVAESGAADRFKKLVYPVGGYGPEFETIGQMLNPMLNAAGFKTQLVAINYTRDFLGSGKGALYGGYDTDALVLAIWMLGGGTAEDAMTGSLLPGGGSNHAHFDDPTVTEMVNKMVATLDQQQRLKAVQDIQRYLADKMYHISAIPTGDVFTLLQPRIRNYAYSLSIDAVGTETYSKLWLVS